MKKLSRLQDKVIGFLKEAPEKRYTARKIAEALMDKYPDFFREKMDRSKFIEDTSQLRNQITAEIATNRPTWESKFPEFRSTDGVRPREYFWTTKTDAEEVEQTETSVSPENKQDLSAMPSNGTIQKFSEAELYPILIQYFEDERSFRGFRVDEKKSSNKNGAGGNRWLFPDIVGIEYLTSGMHEEVVTTVRESRSRQLSLWSFEVKILLNRSNVRESYFQAVSNSSWSNYGYLACSRIEGAGTQDELRILYAMHGIGIIQINYDEPSESQILIPARERREVEWSMVSRLASENTDFRDYVRKIRQYYQTGDIR